MIFTKTDLEGLYLIEPEKHEDIRGFFARVYCVDEFTKNGLDPEISQCSLSYNKRSGTLRGLHYQADPYGEIKVVRCLHGKIFDVAVDIRKDSKTRGKYFTTELNDENHNALYIPKGFAHGFMTLSDDTLVHYQMSTPFNANSGRTIRYDDPEINIPWPNYIGGGGLIVSDKDRAAPLWKDIKEE